MEGVIERLNVARDKYQDVPWADPGRDDDFACGADADKWKLQVGTLLTCTASPSLAAVPAAECAVLVSDVHVLRLPGVRAWNRTVGDLCGTSAVLEALQADLPALIDLTIATFRPLFEKDLPRLLDPVVYAHDHGSWEDGYRKEVPSLHDPQHNRFITLAEDAENSDRPLGYVGWQINPDGSGRLEMVAVHPQARRQGVGSAVCRAALADLQQRGVTVVHIGTGGDAFHAPARSLYESLGFTSYPVVDYTRAI